MLPHPVQNRTHVSGAQKQKDQRDKIALALNYVMRTGLRLHRILTGRKRDAPTVADPALPDAEANQLQALQRTSVKCSSASASFPGGLPFSVGVTLMFTVVSFSPSGEGGQRAADSLESRQAPSAIHSG